MMRIASWDTMVVSSRMKNGPVFSFSTSVFSTFPAILSILSFTVLSDSGIVFNLLATCGPHILSAILMQAGLISVSPMVCGFLSLAMRREHSRDAIVANLLSLPAFKRLSLMFCGLLAIRNFFFLRKTPSVFSRSLDVLWSGVVLTYRASNFHSPVCHDKKYIHLECYPSLLWTHTLKNFLGTPSFSFWYIPPQSLVPAV